MKNHIKVYLKEMGYDESDFIPCEIPGCGQRAVDVHHIDCRGMGGTNSKDVIENLMALCRNHHNEYGDIKELKEILQQIHLKQLK
jgi:hypothetical protein